jgi:hypothetical protein
MSEQTKNCGCWRLAAGAPFVPHGKPLASSKSRPTDANITREGHSRLGDNSADRKESAQTFEQWLDDVQLMRIGSRIDFNFIAIFCCYRQ